MNTMKTENKNLRRKGLPLRDHRWQWMAAAAAGTAAGVTSAHASFSLDVRVDLADNNYINSYYGNHLNADLTGSGTTDVGLSSSTYSYDRLGTTTTTGPKHRFWRAAVKIKGSVGTSSASGTFSHTTSKSSSSARYYRAGIGTTGSSHATDHDVDQYKNIDLTFSDSAVNLGVSTPGTLDVEAFAGGYDAGVYLLSYSYTATSPYAALEAARSQISALLQATTLSPKNSKQRRALEEALNDINQALSAKNWSNSDTSPNQNVFQASLASIQTLAAIAKAYPSLANDAESAMYMVAYADLSLAETAVNAAFGHISTHNYNDAGNAVALADNALFSHGKYVQSVTDSANAFRYTLL